MTDGRPDFNEFYRSHYPGLLRVFIFIAEGDVDLASEAVDEAMTVAYSRWYSLERPLAYVHTVALHWLIKEKAKARRAIPTAPEEIAEKPDHIDGQAIWEQQTWVVWLLEQLPPAQRAALACAFDDLKSTEVAELLGMTPEAVRQNLSAARKRLRKYLGNGEESR